ncbi:MAG: NUDIX domain-containing protein [Planctomycetota bacterium]|jgi:ADP-ribose pyrophosphatase|nr:NUDIX domain-containing protein [Planctomycetota bacterium]
MTRKREPEVTGETVVAAGRFIILKRLDWLDSAGVRRTWEAADRPGEGGAVVIIPWLRPSGRLLHIRQFRPPARRQVLEFPAGLAEAGEEPAAAAARELREETGYTAREIRIRPAAYSSAGLSGEAVYTAEAEIDENAPENIFPETRFDPSENIEAILVPGRELIDFRRRGIAGGIAFDAKLAAWLDGLAAAGGL